ncbi:MAG: NAD(P)H-hydrate dehydratase [Flavobacteriales bacterium]|nr:NAD(P)H-hydrate dehydratase [Flavobacteriales bacterium]
MIPVLGPAAIREADAWTIANEPITPWALMERAAHACAHRILAVLERYGRPPVVVVVGMGNNGGDGLVIARQLRQSGYEVQVVRVRHRPEPSADNARNVALALEAGVKVTELTGTDQWAPPPTGAWIVDALLGTGLNEPLTGLAAEVVQVMNRSACPIISIDLPSGLFAESNTANDPERIVRATRTLSLELPKLVFLLPENDAFVGEWEIVPIGLDRAFIAGCETPYHVVEEGDVRNLMPPRERFAHKGSFGHALIAAGSEGRMGAAALAVQACLRSGAGLVTAHIPACGRDVLQSISPEAMCRSDPGASHLTQSPELKGFSAIGLGPGIGTHPETKRVVLDLLTGATLPVVVDADALNILAQEPQGLDRLPEQTILTPHPKEFDRLAGRTFSHGYDRVQHARGMAERWQCHIVLKGRWTAICGPAGQVRFNPTGNAGMAKGGSGDALTGLIAGLLAQGIAPEAACLLAVYAHGRAGDIAAASIGMDGMTAANLVQSIPAAWRTLRGGSE